MKHTKKNSVCAFAVFAGLLAILPSAEVASAQTKIAIASPGALSVTISIPLAIAQEQGLFGKRGLEIRVNVGIPPLVGKESELGFVGAPAALLQIAQHGTDLKILGAFSTGRISGHLVTRAEIKRPEDLRGKRLGVGAIGAANWISVILALQHFGLDPKRDNITILSVGGLPQIAKALEDGAIDAAMLNPAQSSQMRSRGFLVLLDMYPSNVYGGQIVLDTTGTYLQQHPDVVEKVVTALIESTAFSLSPTNKSTVLNTIVKTFNITDPVAAEEGYQGFLLDAIRKPYPSVERLRNMQKIMALHDPKVLNVRIEDLIEDRFVRKLDESGVIDRFYRLYGVR